MSEQSSVAQYSFSIQDNNLSSASGTFQTYGGFTDEFMLQMNAALAALSWPEGTLFSIVRQEITTISYVPDSTSNPPVFD